jgi:exodeoxyribonuclease VII large subunit
MEPVGLGALQLAFEQLKARLEAEGLFDPGRKKPLPYLPTRVGVVTSGSGAAIRDILNVLRRRRPHLEVTVVPVAVQGEGAASQIAEGIERLHADGTVEVIIVGRGGGAYEDLWAFNEEVVARAIAAAEIPVVSAVGHEVDFTIADFVADLRAPTPSAAAEVVVAVPEGELREQLAAMETRLQSGFRRDVTLRRDRVAQARSRLKDPRRVLQDLRLRIDEDAERITLALQRRVQHVRTALEGAGRALHAHNPHSRVLALRTHMGHLTDRLAAAHMRHVAAARARLGEASAQLDALSPLDVLSRGYAISRNARSGRVVRSFRDVAIGQDVDVQLGDGWLRATVKQRGAQVGAVGPRKKSRPPAVTPTTTETPQGELPL